MQLFSGASEDALVQWNLVKGTKSFLPRLGETIEVMELPAGNGDGRLSCASLAHGVHEGDIESEMSVDESRF